MLIQGDARHIPLKDGSVQTCVTSPPYWGLRSYKTPPRVWGGAEWHDHAWGEWIESHDERETTLLGKTRTTDRFYGDQSRRFNGNHQKHQAGAFCECGAWLGELGLEPSPELYIQHIVEVFREVWRILRDDGTAWLNIGDSFSGGNKGNSGPLRPGDKQATNNGSCDTRRRDSGTLTPARNGGSGLVAKQLLMIPARVALALQADGWFLRSDIIWGKLNAMPESVEDRPVRSHEYVFLLAKSERYFYDRKAIMEPASEGTYARLSQPRVLLQPGGERDYGGGENPNRSARKILTNLAIHAKDEHNSRMNQDRDPAHPEARKIRNDSVDGLDAEEEESGPLEFERNKRDVWFIACKPERMRKVPCPGCGAPWDVRDSESQTCLRCGEQWLPPDHYAMFPEALIEPCILAGSRPGDIVLDPFIGSGTTGKVCERLGRRWVGLDLSTKYVAIARRKTSQMGLGL